MSITRNTWWRSSCIYSVLRRLNDNDLSYNDDIFNLALNDLQDKVLSMGGRELSWVWLVTATGSR